MSDDLSLLQDMDPRAAEEVRKAQSLFAGSISAVGALPSGLRIDPPAAFEENDDDEIPGAHDDNDDDDIGYADESIIPSRFRKHFASIPEEDEKLSDQISSSSTVERKKQESFEQRLKYVIDITGWANQMKKSCPSEEALLRMSADALYVQWSIWQEKYNRESQLFVARYLLAYIGKVLGFSFNYCYKFLIKADYTDMEAWAQHWFIQCTVKRPGRTMPFDASLLVFIQRWSWVRRAAGGELYLLMQLVQSIESFKKQQQEVQKEQERKARESEDRMLNKMQSKMEAMFQARYSTDMPSPIIKTGGGAGEVASLMNQLPFDQEEDEETETVAAENKSGQHASASVRSGSVDSVQSKNSTTRSTSRASSRTQTELTETSDARSTKSEPINNVDKTQDRDVADGDANVTTTMIQTFDNDLDNKSLASKSKQRGRPRTGQLFDLDNAE